MTKYLKCLYLVYLIQFYLRKGRLPTNDNGINEAFEVCLARCLQKLQWKNPARFPSPSILKREHRDNRYVPLIASELALMCHRSSRQDIAQTVLSWSDSSGISRVPSQSHTVETLTEQLENRIRHILAINEKETKVKSKGKGGKKRNTKSSDEHDDASDHDTTSSEKSLSQFIGDSYPNDSEKAKQTVTESADEWYDSSLDDDTQNGKPQGSPNDTVSATRTDEWFDFDEW